MNKTILGFCHTKNYPGYHSLVSRVTKNVKFAEDKALFQILKTEVVRFICFDCNNLSYSI